MIRKINGIKVTPKNETVINRSTTEDITGTTAETILTTLSIPANTFKAGEVFGIESRMRMSGANGHVTIRIRLGSTQSTSEELLGTFVTSAVNDTFLPIMRRVAVKVLDGTGSGTEVVSASTSMSTDITSIGNGVTTLTTDWEVANYIIITGQLGNEDDIMNCMFIYVDLPSAI